MALQNKNRLTLGREETKHNVLKVSEHIPTHITARNDEELGDYLAGLIEGSGWITRAGIRISLKEKDLAYRLKKRIGNGKVSGSEPEVIYSITKRIVKGDRKGWWLAGLIDGKGELKITLSDPELRVEVRLEIGLELNATQVIKDLDRYNLQSRKYKDYLKWRKVYRMIQEGDHLNEKGIKKILKLKNSMCKIKS